MKKYLAFYGLQYYPEGGMRDCLGTFDNLEDACNAVLAQKKLMRPDTVFKNSNQNDWDGDWFEIYNTETNELTYGRK